MNEVWTSLDEKNNFIRRSNESNCNIEVIVDKIALISKTPTLANIEQICRNKAYKLDEEFEKQGMEMFNPHGNIARCIRNDLSSFTEDGTKELGKIVNALSLTYPAFMTSSNVFTSKLFSIICKNYRELCSRAQNYTIKDNLHRVLFDFYRDNRYWIFVPGSYIQSWEEQKKELIQLGYGDFVIENEESILKLIKMQEEKSKAFALKKHNGTEQKLTDEELAAELTRLSKEKEDLEAKYADEKIMTR